MDTENIAKGTQEQATAAWVNYLNQIRLDRFVSEWNKQNQNMTDAMEELSKTLSDIKQIMESNRGGSTGIHGFFAETADCGIRNARQIFKGEQPTSVWINDNGPSDIIRDGQEFQVKFVQSGGHLSMQAINQHFKAYPDYLQSGKKYQIPKDHYEKIMYYHNMPKSQADKMPTSTGDFSLKQWKEVNEFFSSGEITTDDIEPSVLSYGEVQKGTVEGTINKEKSDLKKKDKAQKQQIYNESKPSISEGAKITAVSAGVEGAITLVMAISAKWKAGRKISEFETEDWINILKETGSATGKGAVRGLSIYMLTNYTATPAAVANGVITASFGIAEQAHLLRIGQIDEKSFIENSELLCLDTAVSALSAMIGQMVIPVPLLGPIIGNAVGTFIYQFAKDNLSQKEQSIITSYMEEIEELDTQLSKEQQEFISHLTANLTEFISLLNCAFSPDPDRALIGSVELAEKVGVPSEDILDTPDKITSYFMD